MKFRAFIPVLGASLALTLGAAACGSSSTSSVKSSLSHAASSHGVTNTSAAKSSLSHAASSHGVTNTSAAKSSLSHAASSHGVTNTSAAKSKVEASSSAAKYKAGEVCSSSNASAYKTQHFECVNGHLKSTSTTTKSSTST